MAVKRKATKLRAGPKKAAKRAPRQPQATDTVSDVSTRSVLDGSMKSLVRERFSKHLRG